MYSLILSTAMRFLMPLMLLFSWFVLLRGHNEPGGGFVGGLVAAAAFALHAIAGDPAQTRRLLHTDPRRLIAIGLLVAAGSGLPSLLLGSPFMTGLWWPDPLPAIGKVGTPFLFDVGVYLVVFGVSMTILMALWEE
jgi:multicomponent Na+:H+ antiporter subunit B